MYIRQVPKPLLNVKSESTFRDLAEQAAEVVSSVEGSDIAIVMMHQPTPDQMADLQDLAEKGPVALIGGQFSLMLHVREQLLNSHRVVEAITDRVAVETIMPDGSVVKKSVFKYCGLRVLS